MRTTIASLFLLIGSLLGAAACHNEPEIQPRLAELAGMPGVTVKIAGADLDHAQAQAIAKHVEAKVDGAAAVMVRLKKDGEGAGALEVSLYAETLPASETLTADLKTAFPALAGATITAGPATDAPVDLPVLPVGDALSPEEAKQAILEQLAADSAGGEVDVQVHDGPDQRRIEVKVEKKLHE
jgi:hypothetical protein